MSGKAAMEASAKHGNYTLLSDGYFLDLLQPASFHYANDPIPADSPLTFSESKFILGGEAAMWTEIVSEETIDSRIWPRTVAIAERLWSPQEIVEIESMYERMANTSIQLEDLGLTHLKNTDMMLRRMVGEEDLAVLKKLVDVIEPVKGYKRHELAGLQSYSPLTRLPDATPPESVAARKFNHLVAVLTGGNGEVEYVNILKSALTL